MANEPASDLDVEAQWYEEIGGLLDSAAAGARRFAGLLRLAGQSLRPDEIDVERVACRRLFYRIGQILTYDQQRDGGRIT